MITCNPTHDRWARCLSCGKSEAASIGAETFNVSTSLSGSGITQVQTYCGACLTALNEAIYPFRSHR